MNAKIALAAGMMAIFAAIWAVPSQAAFAATVNIDIVPGASTKTTDAFSPNPAEAHVGDTVTWVNKDGALHSIQSGTSATADGKFGLDANKSPILLPPGKSMPWTATAAGTYPYFCSLHPAM